MGLFKKQYKEPDVSLMRELAVKCAKIFDLAQIPYVLWGDLALTQLGCHTTLKTVQFVVPDHRLRAANNVILLDNDFKECKKGGRCFDKRKSTLVPMAETHYHDEKEFPNCTIVLYEQSSICWKIPSLFAPDHPCVMQVNDDDLINMFSGPVDSSKSVSSTTTYPFTQDMYPVKMLAPKAYIHSLMLLACRDWDYVDGCKMKNLDSAYNIYWANCLRSLARSKTVGKIITEDDIEPVFRPMWESFGSKGTHGSDYERYQSDLRKKLIPEGLPESPCATWYKPHGEKP